MDSASLRRSEEAEIRWSERSMDEAHSDTSEEGFEIPKYIIDLSLAPVRCYQHVAADFKARTAALFDELVQYLMPNARVRRVRRLARVLLRRVYYEKENEELRGISQTAGVKMWLLVACNVLLDLFMGCISGGVMVGHTQESTKMLHFRTLDWEMGPLRKLVVLLDFVEKSGGDIVASSITYVGYVGVLIGVRKWLRMSLNFRPNHGRSTKRANCRLRFHQLLVLLGYRPSISSILRQQLLPSWCPSQLSAATMPTLEMIEETLPIPSTTAAYLIFSDGERTVTIEKNHRTTTFKSSSTFIVKANHDEVEEESSESRTPEEKSLRQRAQAPPGMQEIVEKLSRIV